MLFFGAAFLGASFFTGAAFDLDPTLNDPMPPEVGGLGPSMPPIPAILPCCWLRDGPLVTGTNAVVCAASRMEAVMNLRRDGILVF